jgi:hypothetical protein
LIKVAFLAYLPVIGAIMVMIVLRANDLAREATEGGLEPGPLVPTTPNDAIVIGFTIWIFGAFLIALLATALYHAWRIKLRLGPISYFVLVLALAAGLSAGLFVAKVPFAPEGTFEMFACGIGYGVLIPVLYARERDLTLYRR